MDADTKEFLNNTLNKAKNGESFAYQFLSRLQSDCNYYLGYGNRSKKVLWFQSEKEHINYMKELWNAFSEQDKPEWLTMEQIEKYEKEMCGGKNEV